jgi:hypothetical protein
MDLMNPPPDRMDHFCYLRSFVCDCASLVCSFGHPDCYEKHVFAWHTLGAAAAT